MRISDWSSDVCSSDLRRDPGAGQAGDALHVVRRYRAHRDARRAGELDLRRHRAAHRTPAGAGGVTPDRAAEWSPAATGGRSEEHTSELQSLMRRSYAVFCLKQNKHVKTYIQIQKTTQQ